MKPSRDKRRRMWEEDPHCLYCGRATIWRVRDGSGKPDPLEATLEHLRSRYDPRRREKCHGERRVFIACWECNNKQNSQVQSSVPIAERRERSKRHT